MANSVQLSWILLMLCGAVMGGGLVLLVSALQSREVTAHTSATVNSGLLLRLGRRGMFALAAGIIALVFTQWIVGGIAIGVLVLFGPALFGGARAERKAMARLEGLAGWTESLRDTIAGAVGLEQAIPATALAAAPAVSGPLVALADRLRVRTPMPLALAKFADDLDDASADLIVASLILNAKLRGPGLRQVLGSLSEAVREDLDMRRRIAASRSSTRKSVQIVVGITIFIILFMVVFNRRYLQPYGTFYGQLVLALVAGLFAAGFAWMKRLSRYDMPERFLRPEIPRGGQ